MTDAVKMLTGGRVSRGPAGSAGRRGSSGSKGSTESSGPPERARGAAVAGGVMEMLSGRVRELRRARRLSLDQLSARASVSKGMLVQIENGQANPSIAILCKVAAALGASVADLRQIAGQGPVQG